jgi:PAS domain S-box-containing protein
VTAPSGREARRRALIRTIDTPLTRIAHRLHELAAVSGASREALEDLASEVEREANRLSDELLAELRRRDEIAHQNIRQEQRIRERTAQLEQAASEKDETLARLLAVLNQMPAGVVIAEAASREIVTVNEQAKALLAGVRPDEKTEPMWPYALKVAPAAMDRPMARALDAGERTSGELMEFIREDGTHGVFEVSAAPIRDREGNVVSAVGTFRDVTARERRARVEREFVTNAAHELRTPLAALASAVEVLQAGAKENEHDRDRFLGYVEQQCDRLQRLVRSLLVLARAQSGQERGATETIDVATLLAEVAALLPRERIRVDLRDAPGAAVVANRDLAEQALLNLVSNALKYAPDGDVLLAGRTDGGFVKIEVSDSGPGMDSEQRQRALERFYRGPSEVGEDGFGLGLSIAAQVAETLGGSLELERASDAGGTIARLILPAAEGHR